MPQKPYRPYQQESINAAHIHLNDRGYDGTIIHQATGLGKTLTAAGYLDQHIDLNVQRALFIVNYQTIVHQTARAFTEQLPYLKEHKWTKYGRPGIGIVMGNQDERTARFVVGTPQTLSTVSDEPSPRLLKLLEEGPFDLVVYDEAHYSVAKSYLNMHKVLKEANPNVKALGLTATPQRQDGMGLNQMFNTICISRNIRWGIANGFLCDILPPLNIETNLDLPDVGFSLDERVKALDVGNWAAIVLEAWMEHGENRPTVAFMSSVAHSERFVEYLNENGIPAAHIDGERCIGPNGESLPISKRVDLFRMHQQGDIKVLSNFNVLTVGWDAPWVSCILNGRPTDNAVLLTQMIGRGTRLYPGKENLKVIDFTLRNTGLLLSGTLLGYSWDDKEQKYEDEEEAVEEDFLEGMDLRDFHTDDSLVSGKGLVVSIGSLFRKLHEAWYNDPNTNTLSVSASETAMFLIHCPNYTLANQLRLGIENGEKYLAEHPEDPQAAAYYDALLKGYDLFSQYTGWFIQGVKNEETGKVYWKNPDNWIAGADSVELVFDYLAPYLGEAEDPTLSRKNKSWRKPSVLPTDAQLGLLSRWGVDIPEGITRGQASQMIGHKIAYDKVQPLIEQIRLACRKYGRLDALQSRNLNPVYSEP